MKTAPMQIERLRGALVLLSELRRWLAMGQTKAAATECAPNPNKTQQRAITQACRLKIQKGNRP